MNIFAGSETSSVLVLEVQLPEAASKLPYLPYLEYDLLDGFANLGEYV